MELTIFISHVANKEDNDQMNRKVSLYLILGLILIGFVVAPVTACLEIVGLQNGDICLLNDNTGTWQYYSHITGKWTTNGKGGVLNEYLLAPAIDSVNPLPFDNKNSYSNSFVPQTNPSPIIVKPLLTKGKTNGDSRFTQVYQIKD